MTVIFWILFLAVAGFIGYKVLKKQRPDVAELMEDRFEDVVDDIKDKIDDIKK